MHIVHHVLAVHHQLLVPGHAQGHVQHGAVLGGVDVPAGEHGIAVFLEAGPASHREESVETLLVDAVLRVVEEEVSGGHGHPRPPVAILGEEIA